MNMHQLLLTKNKCYTTGAKLAPTGIVVHSTGANNPYLKRYVGPDDGLLGVNKSGNNWNQPNPDGRDVCVHAFIGKLEDGTVATYQTLPWNMRGWHAGGKANDTHIGFEICEDGLADANYFALVYREAVELCAFLCKTYNIKPNKPSLICHCEGAELGICSSHADVMHWFPKFGKSMDTLRADVSQAMSEPQPKDKPDDENLAAIEATVNNAAADGLISDKLHWTNVLTGKTPANKDYIKIMMDNAHKLINK